MFLATDIRAMTHFSYLIIGIGVTVWVARTLRIHGRVFLTRGCKGNEELTNSLSHLLSVGFYLLHVGLVLLALKFGGHPLDPVSAIEILSTKIGLVLLALGVSHFLHLALYARIHGKPSPSRTMNEYVSAEVIRG